MSVSLTISSNLSIPNKRAIQKSLTLNEDCSEDIPEREVWRKSGVNRKIKQITGGEKSLQNGPLAENTRTETTTRGLGKNNNPEWRQEMGLK